MSIPSKDGTITAAYQENVPQHGTELRVLDVDAGDVPDSNCLTVTWPAVNIFQVQAQPALALQPGGNPRYPDLLYGLAFAKPPTGTVPVNVTTITESGEDGTMAAAVDWQLNQEKGVRLEVYAQPLANGNFLGGAVTAWWVTYVSSNLVTYISPDQAATPPVFTSIPFEPLSWPLNTASSWNTLTVSAFNWYHANFMGNTTPPPYATPTLTAPGYQFNGVSAGSLPSWMTFTDNGDGSGTIAGTPPAGSAGNYAVEVQATNNGGTATSSFSIIVS